MAVSGKADDAVRALGVDPKPVPTSSDTLLLERVRADQGRLLAGAGKAPVKVRDALAEQFDAVGGSNADVAGDPIADLRSELVSAAKKRKQDAVVAVSPDLVKVLASMAAGLAVLAEEVA